MIRAFADALGNGANVAAIILGVVAIGGAVTAAAAWFGRRVDARIDLRLAPIKTALDDLRETVDDIIVPRQEDIGRRLHVDRLDTDRHQHERHNPHDQ